MGLSGKPSINMSTPSQSRCDPLTAVIQSILDFNTRIVEYHLNPELLKKSALSVLFLSVWGKGEINARQIYRMVLHLVALFF